MNHPRPRRTESHPVLDDVKRATGFRSPPAPPAIDPALVRTLAPGADLAAIFAERARALGVDVERVSRDTLARAARARTDKHGPAIVETALLERFPDLEDIGLRDASEEALFEAGCGVTGVRFAVAETGSLVVCSGPGRPRRLSLVPPVHVAVIDESQIVADFGDVLAEFRDGSLPSNLVVVTGPSRTADIAQRLVKGVHGPARVECLVVV